MRLLLRYRPCAVKRKNSVAEPTACLTGQRPHACVAKLSIGLLPLERAVHCHDIGAFGARIGSCHKPPFRQAVERFCRGQPPFSFDEFVGFALLASIAPLGTFPLHHFTFSDVEIVLSSSEPHVLRNQLICQIMQPAQCVFLLRLPSIEPGHQVRLECQAGMMAKPLAQLCGQGKHTFAAA